ncbi:hypothetical protein LXL04_037746 [Taraxacum kok-saghyz]
MTSGAMVFNGCRTLFAAAKSATPKSTATAATTTTAAKRTIVKKLTEKPTKKPKQASAEKSLKPIGILKLTPNSPPLGHFLGVSRFKLFYPIEGSSPSFIFLRLCLKVFNFWQFKLCLKAFTIVLVHMFLQRFNHLMIRLMLATLRGSIGVYRKERTDKKTLLLQRDGKATRSKKVRRQMQMIFLQIGFEEMPTNNYV